MIEELVKNIIGKMDTAIIAKITKIEKGFVNVEPVAEFQDVALPPIFHVPMCQLGNKIINIKINFKVGDVVPILICSRDISGYITKEVGTVNTNKRYNLTNAIALPILISTDLNNIDIPEAIEINGDLILNGDLNINGNVEIKGKLKVKSIETDKVDVKIGVSKGEVPYVHP